MHFLIVSFSQPQQYFPGHPFFFFFMRSPIPHAFSFSAEHFLKKNAGSYFAIAPLVQSIGLGTVSPSQLQLAMARVPLSFCRV